MTFTPTMKGSFLAGIGLWLMLWLGLFKLDEVVGGHPLMSVRIVRWMSSVDIRTPEHNSTRHRAG